MSFYFTLDTQSFQYPFNQPLSKFDFQLVVGVFTDLQPIIKRHKCAPKTKGITVPHSARDGGICLSPNWKVRKVASADSPAEAGWAMAWVMRGRHKILLHNNDLSHHLAFALLIH